MEELTNINNKAFMNDMRGSAWLRLRLDLFSTSMVTVSAGLVLILHLYVGIEPALSGLVLSYSTQLTGLLQYTTRVMAQVDALFTSVERLQHYATHIPQVIPLSASRPLDLSRPFSWKYECFLSINVRCVLLILMCDCGRAMHTCVGGNREGEDSQARDGP